MFYDYFCKTFGISLVPFLKAKLVSQNVRNDDIRMKILSEVKEELLVELGVSSWDSNLFIDNLIESNNLFKMLDLK